MADIAIGPKITLNGTPEVAETKPAVVAAEVSVPVATPATEKPLDLNYHGDQFQPNHVPRMGNFPEADHSVGHKAIGIVAAGLGGVAAGMALNAVASKKVDREFHLSGNPANWDRDFSGYGTGTRTGALHNAMHAAPGALSCLAGKNAGFDWATSSAMAFATGFGIEVGETAGDWGDVMRTGVYGTAACAAAWNIDKFAERKYDETGNPLFKVLAQVVNPERGFGVGVSKQGKHVVPMLTYSATWK